MPPGPRKLPRFRSSAESPITPTYKSPSRFPEPPALPKHISFPHVPKQSILFYDIVMAVFGSVAMLLQLLNIYKSSWWLPGTGSQVLKYYLIDPKICAFGFFIFYRNIYFMLGYSLFLKIYHDPNKPAHYLSPPRKGVLYFMYIAYMGILVALISNTFEKLVYLLLPFVVYLIVYRGQIAPFFETSTWNYSTDVPIHACSSNSVDVRKECEFLKNDFNNRLQHILFNSVLHGYFAGFLPICFAQSQLVYDKYWCWQNTILIAWSSGMFSVVNLLPLRYWDILHRSATHLGMWKRLENHAGLGSCKLDCTTVWEDTLWSNGVILKYHDHHWQAVGECIANKPGNNGMNRYYNMFIFPPFMHGCIFVAHLSVIVYQLTVLYYLICWEKTITMSIITFFNFWAFYKTSGDVLVSNCLYKLVTDDTPYKQFKHIVQKSFDHSNDMRKESSISRLTESDNNMENALSFKTS